MTTAQDLIRRSSQNPVRRVYIKRRTQPDGAFEASWFRIDNYLNKERIVDYNSVSIEIDHEPDSIANFNVSGYTLRVDNTDGAFNLETDPNSIWFSEANYLNRKYTKLKIECGYLDSDDSEIGVVDVFEGLVERITIRPNGLATITVLSYQNLLQRCDISDLAMTGTKTADAIVTLIMNQSKITEYIPYIAPTALVNSNIESDQLTGTYWDVLKRVAMLSNSIPFLRASAFKFVPRTAGAVAFDFKSLGVDGFDDLYSLNSYDDEGAGKIRVYWNESSSNIIVQSSDTLLRKKYIAEPANVSFTELTDDGQKRALLLSLLRTWERPKPVISFTTKFMLNELEPLDSITISYTDLKTISANNAKWNDGTKWDDGTKWGKKEGIINIPSYVKWMVTKVNHDMQNWKTVITAERIGV